VDELKQRLKSAQGNEGEWLQLTMKLNETAQVCRLPPPPNRQR
jgi:hypothetical protein